MIPIAIERIDDRLALVRTSAEASGSALQPYVIKDSYQHYTDHPDAELASGVVTIVSAGEADYSNAVGYVAAGGVQRLLFIAHLRVAETDSASLVEMKELALCENIKTFIRSGIPGVGLRLISLEHSRQLDHPYGWVVADVHVAQSLESNY